MKENEISQGHNHEEHTDCFMIFITLVLTSVIDIAT